MTSVAAQDVQSASAARAVTVEARGIGLSIDERAILTDVNLQVSAGEIVALMGHNGAGKSTLLSVLAMLAPPTRGQLRLLGEPAGPERFDLRARIGMIAHQAMLYRDLSGRENLEFFARLYDVKDWRGQSARMLELVGLAGRANDPVKNLSRGMIQRMAIARALLHDPPLVLADEPFDGLDETSRGVLGRLLKNLRETGKTVILSSHDIALSLSLADRAVVLRKGRVVLDAPAAGLSTVDLNEAIRA